MNVHEPIPKKAELPGSRTFQRRCLGPTKRWNAMMQDRSRVPVTARRGDVLR